MIDILTHIGAKYDKFGTCLLEDDDGGKMEIIKEDHNSVEKKLKNIMKKWFDGKFIQV